MRRVRRLQLSAPTDGLRHRGQLLLEDALRTATLPGAEEARLYLVRSLRLGVIDPRGGSARLARTIEERLRQTGLTACPGEDPAAEHAPVVVFASALEASIALAIRLGRGVPARGWHWPLAVPAFRSGASPGENLRALLLASLELPGGALASAIWLEALVEASAAEPLLASLSAAEAEGLLRWGGWEPTPDRPAEAGPPTGPTAPLPPAWRTCLSRWLPRWGARDSRGLWLVAMALVARQPARIGAPAVLARARGILFAEEGERRARERSLEPDPARWARPATPAAQDSSAETSPQPSDEGRSPLPPTSEAAAAPPPPPAAGTPPSPGPVDQAGELSRPQGAHRDGLGQPQAAEAVPPPLPSHPTPGAGAAEPVLPSVPPLALGEPSAVAGLAFLVVLLQLEGIEGWLERHPALLDVDWPRRLLRGLADGLGAPAADPLSHALGLTSLEPLPATDATALEDRAVLASLSRHWRRRLRRWCHTPGRPGLTELVRRPGIVVVSRTHLEVWFDPRQAEIRVRRFGLDCDPGWVPWLGRVVTFHYDRRGPGDGEG